MSMTQTLLTLTVLIKLKFSNIIMIMFEFFQPLLKKVILQSIVMSIDTVIVISVSDLIPCGAIAQPTIVHRHRSHNEGQHGAHEGQHGAHKRQHSAAPC